MPPTGNAVAHPKTAQLAKQREKEEERVLDLVVVPEPFPMKPIPSKVLTEDDYTDAVSHIIERDFFPDLAHLRLKHELLQARKNGDLVAMQELQWKLINISRPTPLSSVAATPGRFTPSATPMQADMSGGATPAGATPRISAWERDDDVQSTVGSHHGDTPRNACLQLVNGKQVVVDLEKVRLDDFHRVFTSEDNAAFEDVIKRDNELKKFKQWWIEDAELKHNTEFKHYKLAILEGKEFDKNFGNALLGTEFKGRNTMSFKVQAQAQVEIEKPKVDFKNTRFTTAQQSELDGMLGISMASRQAAMAGDLVNDAGERMASSGHFGKFGLSAFQAQGAAGMRAVGAQLANQSPNLPGVEVRGYPLVSTPVLLPGVGGMSPLMTYGKLGSTPRCLDEGGPSFFMNEAGAREKAAEKLQRGATQKLRETKQQTKAERLRALGLTPAGSSTPVRTGRTTPGSGRRFTTPGSMMSKISPLSPIGALIQNAKRMSQQGGRLHIGRTPTPAPSPAHPRAEEAPRKRRRKSSSAVPDANRLPASITDDLL